MPCWCAASELAHTVESARGESPFTGALCTLDPPSFLTQPFGWPQSKLPKSHWPQRVHRALDKVCPARYFTRKGSCAVPQHIVALLALWTANGLIPFQRQSWPFSFRFNLS
eukprot:468555-Pleurochrysis_carterae.AAC.2